ncbi:rho GTPase-activating protein 29-like [Panonychus citri]|uniref:rho GTPase-activating protein 29-like n=1 Tax=Panonychus citri TaxID=50023 RepID=UPI0023072861|nr:rho GTPase-activating protein 29-like [Panonychus citri]
MSTFGVDLKSRGDEIPYIVVKCVTELEKRGKCVKGLYRVSGVKSRVDKLCRSFEKGNDVGDLSDVHPNVIANVLKLYLRQLPEPLLTYKAYSEFIRIAKQYPLRTRPEEDPRLTERIVTCLKEATSKLPLIHYQTLSYLCHHLKSIADNHLINNMPPSNLGIVFGPTLLRTNEGPAGLCSLVDNVHQTRVVQLLITLADKIFGSPQIQIGQKIVTSTTLPHLPGTSSSSTPTTTTLSLKLTKETKRLDDDDEEEEEDELEYECIEEDVEPEPPREIRKSKSSIIVMNRDPSATTLESITNTGGDKIPRPTNVVDLNRLRQYNPQSPSYYTSTAVIKLSPGQASRLTGSSLIPSKQSQQLQNQPQLFKQKPQKPQHPPPPPPPPSQHQLQQSQSQSFQQFLQLPQSQPINLGLTRSSTMTSATPSTTMTSTSTSHKPSLNELRRAFFTSPSTTSTSTSTLTSITTTTIPTTTPTTITQRLYRPTTNASASSLISLLHSTPPSTSPSPSPSPSPSSSPLPPPTPTTTNINTTTTTTTTTSTLIQLRQKPTTSSSNLLQRFIYQQRQPQSQQYQTSVPSHNPPLTISQPSIIKKACIITSNLTKSSGLPKSLSHSASASNIRASGSEDPNINRSELKYL